MSSETSVARHAGGFRQKMKIRLVLGGLRGEDSIAELCRHEGIAQGLHYSWSKEFLEAGKKRPGRGHRARGIHGRSQGAAPRGP